jgi:hypothetical protein
MDAPTMDLGCALDMLTTQGWFSERSPETQARLGAIAKLRSFTKGDRIYLAGDPPNGMFGLISGSLNISIPGRTAKPTPPTAPARASGSGISPSSPKGRAWSRSTPPRLRAWCISPALNWSGWCEMTLGFTPISMP